MTKCVSLLLIALLVVLVACSSVLEAGIERTPTPDHAGTATVAALMAENSRLTTQVAMLATPAPPPNLGLVACVQGGDIWVKALPDGRPQRLTTDGHNREPRWSFTGQWLAFRKDKLVAIEQDVPPDRSQGRRASTEQVSVLQKQVWLIEANGNSAHPLNQGLSVDGFAWSPTGDRLAYTTAYGELITINADGTALTTLAPVVPDRSLPSRLGRFMWSPDGKWIVYEWTVLSSSRSSLHHGLFKISADAKNQVEIYDSNIPLNNEAILAGWTASGQRVLFWRAEANQTSPTDGASLYSVSADKNPRDVPYKLSEAVLPYTDFIALAPHGTPWGNYDAVALVAGGGKAVWKGKRIELAGQFLTSKDLAAISPVWSPGGTLLAFAAMPDWAGEGTTEPAQPALMQRRIWVINVGGMTPPQRLTDNAGYRDERPLWSADGSYILFARMDVKGRASLWITPADRSSPRQVVDELTPAPDPLGFYGHIDWDVLFDWWRGP